jgi:hypothetical protein
MKTSKRRIVFLLCAAALAATGIAQADPGPKRPPPSLVPFVIRIPISSVRHPWHWIWIQHQTGARPRIADDQPAPEPPGDEGGDLPPG